MGWIMNKHSSVFISYGFFIGIQNHFLKNLSFLTVLRCCLFHKTRVHICMGLLLDPLLSPLVDLGILSLILGFLSGSGIRNPPAMQETWVRSLGWEDPLQKQMATHSSIFAGKIQRTEEPGGLRSMMSQSWTRLKRLNDVRWMMLTKHTVVIISQYVFSWPLNSMSLNCCSLIHSEQMGPLIHRLFSTNTALVISFFTSLSKLSVGKSWHLIRDHDRWHPKN